MADNIAAKDGNDADVILATKEIAGAHYDKVMPADPTTGVPFRAADDATLQEVSAATGAPDDAAATTDTGTFSLIALAKRALQNWTTLLSRLPALVSGRIPVDGSGVTQPVSGPLTEGQLRSEAVSIKLSSDDSALLSDIIQSLGPLMSARAVDGSLRIQSQGGTITTVSTVTGVTTVTTVSTVSNLANQTAIGGLQAVPHIPSLMNMAAASNIDRMVG